MIVPLLVTWLGKMDPEGMLVFRHNETKWRLTMKKKRYSIETIVSVLKQADQGTPVAEITRKLGISEQTYSRWKKTYSGLESDQVREIKQLQEENVRLLRSNLFA